MRSLLYGQCTLHFLRYAASMLTFIKMETSDRYLPIASSDETITLFPSEKPQSNLRKFLNGSVVALCVIGALGLGYSLGSRNCHIAKSSTLGKICDIIKSDTHS
jgi:hypothetical protein